MTEAGEAARWGYLIGLVVIAGLFGLFWTARPWKVFIGQDKRISTSKTIATVWTIVVAAAILGAVYANLLNHAAPLNAMGASGIVGQYAVLFGGPLGAAILAKQIVNGQTKTTPKTTGSPAVKDLIANDAGDTDLGDLQYVLFNFVALVYVVSTLLNAPGHGLPHIPDVLLGLTSVSATGYVGKKALVPSASVTATIDPPGGPPTTLVTVAVSGIAQTKKSFSGWVRFGDGKGDVAQSAAPVSDGNASLQVEAPDLGALANPAVKVVLVTDDGGVVQAGTYTYREAAAEAG